MVDSAARSDVEAAAKRLWAALLAERYDLAGGGEDAEVTYARVMRERYDPTQATAGKVTVDARAGDATR